MNQPEPQVQVVALHPASIDRLAEQVAERLRNTVTEQTSSGAADEPRARGVTAEDRLLSATQVSQWWGVDRMWVYRNADRLGALRLGTGERPRLRFDPAKVAKCLGERAASDRLKQPRRPAAARGRRQCAGNPMKRGDLLPIRPRPELTSVDDQTRRPGGAGTPPATAPKEGPSAR